MTRPYVVNLTPEERSAFGPAQKLREQVPEELPGPRPESCQSKEPPNPVAPADAWRRFKL
jgi:hypothetical protein